MFAHSGYSLQIVSLFLVILSIVIRHAQIIEVSFDISKLSQYMMGVLLLALPQIKIIVDVAPSEGLLFYLLSSLVIFEAIRLRGKGQRFSFVSNALNLILLLLLIYIENTINNTSLVISNSEWHKLTIYIALIGNISYSLVRTCISIAPHVSDRMDLYSLAYFSVAGVLFNYCSENLTALIQEDIKNGDFITIIQTASVAEVLLFIFWLTVLIRVVQSLHLAALDYRDTQLNGIDLLVLTLFYIFISTYWLITSNQRVLFVVLLVLSILVSLYFFWMRFYRIQSESKISIDFDNRIQLVNALTFAIIAVSNYCLILYEYNHMLILIQIFVLGFNILHSYQLTMWIKFDLIFDKNVDEIYFEKIKSADVLNVAAHMSYHFGYIYKYVTGLNKKETRKFIYMLLKSSSRFGEFGRSRYFWAMDSKDNKKVGLICLKSSYNVCLVYNVISALFLLTRLLLTSTPKYSFTVLKGVFANRSFLENLAITSELPFLEVAYIVIDKRYRNQQLSKKLLNSLKMTNLKNCVFYPGKKYALKDIYLIVRADNQLARSSFRSAGFELVRTIEDHVFEKSASVGSAQVMKCSVKESL
ncbi:MAG: hypothetical protein OEL86_19415 [Sulfuritalea sp.]|nr:hypothetical protein [Sulfuritalea sp.]